MRWVPRLHRHHAQAALGKPYPQIVGVGGCEPQVVLAWQLTRRYAVLEQVANGVTAALGDVEEPELD